jgi:hypothetical protein
MSTISKFYLHRGAFPTSTRTTRNRGFLFDAKLGYNLSLSTNAPTSDDCSNTCAYWDNQMDASMGQATHTSFGVSQASGTGRRKTCCFMSGPLAAQTISGTVRLGGAISHSGTTSITYIGATLGVWLLRPSTGEVFTLWDGPGGGVREWDSSTASAAVQAFTGTSRTMTTQTAKDGDVLIVEVGIAYNHAATHTLTWYWDGNTEGSITSNAAYVVFGNPLTLYTPGTLNDDFDGAASTALAAHSPLKGGAWTDSTAGWQLDGMGFIQATNANCRSLFTAGSDGDLDFWDLRSAATNDEFRLIFRYSDASNYWYCRVFRNTSYYDLELHKVVATVDTTVSSATNAIYLSYYFAGFHVRLTENLISVSTYQGSTGGVGHSAYRETAWLYALDSFNATATIIGVQSVTNATTQKVGGIEFIPSAPWSSKDTFHESYVVNTGAAPSSVVSGDTYVWQPMVCLPAAAFLANKSYALFAITQSRDGNCLAECLVHGTTGWPESIVRQGSMGSDGNHETVMVRYDTGVTPETVTLQICGVQGSGVFAFAQIIAVCLNDLGVEGTDWMWSSDATPHNIGTGPNCGDLAARVLEDGPLCYLHLNEAAGTIAYDASPNGRNGTYTGIYVLQQAGKAAQYATDTGDTSVTFGSPAGYVDLPGSWMPTGNAPWSVEFWGNISGYSGPMQVMAWGAAATNQGISIGFDATSSLYASIYGVGDFRLENYADAHQVVTWDGTTLRGYCNGVLHLTATPGDLNVAAAQSIWVGKGFDTYLQGLGLDEVAFYDYRLSDGEIDQHYSEGAYTYRSLAPVHVDIPGDGATPWLVFASGQVTSTGSAQAAGHSGIQDTGVSSSGGGAPAMLAGQMIIAHSAWDKVGGGYGTYPYIAVSSGLVYKPPSGRTRKVKFRVDDYGNGWTSYYSARMLALRLGTNVGDPAATMVADALQTISAGPAFADSVTVSVTPTRTAKFLVFAESHLTQGHVGMWNNPQSFDTATAYERTRSDPDGNGAHSFPAYGDDDGGYMNGASYYYCKEPRRAFAVITLSAGASRTVALQEASTSSTNDYRHIAVFRAPDPTYASPGIAEAGWGVV